MTRTHESAIADTAITSAAHRLLAMAPAAALISPSVPPPAQSVNTLSCVRDFEQTHGIEKMCCLSIAPPAARSAGAQFHSQTRVPTVLCARCSASALLILPAALRTPIDVRIVYVLRRDIAQQVRAKAERVANVCKHRHIRAQP